LTIAKVADEAVGSDPDGWTNLNTEYQIEENSSFIK
jgi:plasmid maintenance system antidote protein VapI